MRIISAIYFLTTIEETKARKEFKKLDCKSIQIDSKDGTINVQVNDQVNVQVKNQNLSTLFGVSEKGIRRDIYVLRDMNLIHHVGSYKTCHWEIADKKEFDRPSSAQVMPK